ncbi:hypothetical protein F5B22DRAFT_614117 [Xylaria bambusicola]|uniref:uncharacterized protein n=1 Tax=Xylaria bambusicola TaxID=326684 RepID=UPI002007B93A|nr:uncharacterized protein F5B22DRAFT_614117 [Xylaria bambusicola]KAI0512769.1 hypothetical protein F5B22DRAFT_614117 [Xylaria bambusicola]
MKWSVLLYLSGHFYEFTYFIYGICLWLVGGLAELVGWLLGRLGKVCDSGAIYIYIYISVCVWVRIDRYVNRWIDELWYCVCDEMRFILLVCHSWICVWEDGGKTEGKGREGMDEIWWI